MTPSSPNPDQPQTRYAVRLDEQATGDITNDPIAFVAKYPDATARFYFCDHQGVWRVEAERMLREGDKRPKVWQWRYRPDGQWSLPQGGGEGLPIDEDDFASYEFRSPPHLIPVSPAPTYIDLRLNDNPIRTVGDIWIPITPIGNEWSPVTANLGAPYTALDFSLCRYRRLTFNQPQPESEADSKASWEAVAQQSDPVAAATTKTIDEVCGQPAGTFTTMREAGLLTEEASLMAALSPSPAPAGPTPDERDGHWIDKFGRCKVCGGEIPQGHTNDCDIFKLESQLSDALRQRDDARQERDCADANRGCWTGNKCSSCLGTGEGKHDRPCSSCSGTGEEWMPYKDQLSSLQSQATRDAEEIKRLNEEHEELKQHYERAVKSHSAAKLDSITAERDSLQHKLQKALTTIDELNDRIINGEVEE